MTQRLFNRISAAGIQIFFLVVLLLSSYNSAAYAQRSKKEKSANSLTTFPIQLLSGGIIIIKVTLDDFPDTLNFVLDTGSSGVSLDSTTVRFFQLPVTPSDRMLRGIGSLKKMSYVINRTLHLPGLDVEHLDFHINDYDLLTSVYGIRIDGIIGYSLFSKYIVKVNYDKNTIEILKPGTVKYPRNGMLIKPAIRNIPVFDASLADEDTVSTNRFYFDTGAGLCLLLSEDFETDSSILKKGKKITLTQAEGLTGKTSMKLSTIKQVEIGKYKFKKVPVHIFKDEYNVTAYPYLGGLIGNDLLRRFNLIVNYGQNEIHLLPNSHFREPFDYSYTGLGVYMVNGQVTIEDVLKESPGEKAGLQPGDVIIAIDNNMSGNIQTFKNMLQSTGARLKLLILRNGSPLDIRLRVQSIL